MPLQGYYMTFPVSAIIMNKSYFYTFSIFCYCLMGFQLRLKAVLLFFHPLSLLFSLFLPEQLFLFQFFSTFIFLSSAGIITFIPFK